MNRFLFLILLLSALSAQARPGLLDSLGLNNPADEPLAVEQAFIFSAQVQDAHSILARWTIAEGNYLYRDKIRFEIAGDNAVQLLDYSLPSGEEKMDETFGLSYVYHHDTDVTLPLNRSDKAQQVVLTAFYQGCSSTFNICYPPTQSQIKINLAAAAKQVPNDLDNTLITSPNPPPLQEQDRIAQSYNKTV